MDYSILLTGLMEAGLANRPYIVFNSDGSEAISMAIEEVTAKYAIANDKHVKCSQHIVRHMALLPSLARRECAVRPRKERRCTSD